MRVEPFTVDHYRALVVQPAQAEVRAYFTEKHAEDMAKFPAFAAVSDEGQVLAIGGLWEPWPNRAIGWAVLGAELKHEFVAIHRAVLAYFARCGKARIEITVQEHFVEAHRWAKALGFRCETPRGMPRYDPAGRTHYLFARVAS